MRAAAQLISRLPPKYFSRSAASSSSKASASAASSSPGVCTTVTPMLEPRCTGLTTSGYPTSSAFAAPSSPSLRHTAGATGIFSPRAAILVSHLSMNTALSGMAGEARGTPCQASSAESVPSSPMPPWQQLSATSKRATTRPLPFARTSALPSTRTGRGGFLGRTTSSTARKSAVTMPPSGGRQTGRTR